MYANDADDPSWGTQKVAFVPVLQRRRDGNVPARKAYSQAFSKDEMYKLVLRSALLAHQAGQRCWGCSKAYCKSRRSPTPRATTTA